VSMTLVPSVPLWPKGDRQPGVTSGEGPFRFGSLGEETPGFSMSCWAGQQSFMGWHQACLVLLFCLARQSPPQGLGLLVVCQDRGAFLVDSPKSLEMGVDRMHDDISCCRRQT